MYTKQYCIFFAENTMLRLWPFWNGCSKGNSPNFGENIVQFYSRGGDNGIWGTWAICMYQYGIKVLVRNRNLERTAEVRWHEVLTYFYTNCFKRLCKLELTIWRNSSKRVEMFLKRKISICSKEAFICLTGHTILSGFSVSYIWFRVT